MTIERSPRGSRYITGAEIRKGTRLRSSPRVRSRSKRRTPRSTGFAGPRSSPCPGRIIVTASISRAPMAIRWSGHSELWARDHLTRGGDDGDGPGVGLRGNGSPPARWCSGSRWWPGSAHDHRLHRERRSCPRWSPRCPGGTDPTNPDHRDSNDGLRGVTAVTTVKRFRGGPPVTEPQRRGRAHRRCLGAGPSALTGLSPRVADGESS